MLSDFKQLKTSPSELRQFGLVVGAVLLGIGAFLYFREKSYHVWLLYPGGLLVVGGLAWPRILKGLYLVWMGLAIALGAVVSTLLLFVFFFLVVTPIGLCSRIARKDFLTQQLAPSAPSYWKKRSGKKAPVDYERQF